MSVEAVISLVAAWQARSPSLLAFGGDSGIELASALVVLWRFRYRGSAGRAEQVAARITGGLLFALAAYVLGVSAWMMRGHQESRPSLLGIAILVAAACVMPLLARQKRRLSTVTKSVSLRADAAESALCAYLAWIALAGLVTNAVWGIRWADPVAAVCVLPLVLWEGWNAFRGKHCGCHGRPSRIPARVAREPAITNLRPSTLSLECWCESRAISLNSATIVSESIDGSASRDTARSRRISAWRWYATSP